jgi:hypothetical protein
MPKVRITKSYSGISPDTCFEHFQEAFQKAGFEVWKTREIAWLVMGKKTEGGGLIEATIGSRPPGSNASVTLSVSSDEIEHNVLANHSDHIFAELEKLLGK